MDDDRFIFIEESIGTKSDTNSSSVCSTCSEIDKNAIRRRILEVDQEITKETVKGKNLRKVGCEAKLTLITLIDTIQNHKEVDKKYELLSNSVENSLTELEKSIGDALIMANFSENILEKLTKDNKRKKEKSQCMNLDENTDPKDYVAIRASVLNQKLALPSVSKLKADLMATSRGMNSESSLGPIMDDYRKATNEYASMIEEATRYFKKKYQKALGQDAHSVDQVA